MLQVNKEINDDGNNKLDTYYTILLYYCTTSIQSEMLTMGTK